MEGAFPPGQSRGKTVSIELFHHQTTGDNHKTVVTAMTQTALTKLGLTAGQCAVLLELGVATERDLAFQFYLQPEMLGNLLAIDRREAERVVQEAAGTIPETELDRLVREAERQRTFGVLPPPGDQGP